MFQITYGPSYPRVPITTYKGYPRVGDLYWVTDRAIPGIPLVVWLSGSIFSHTGIRYLLRHIPGTFPRGAPLWGGMCRNLPSLPPTWYLSSCRDVRGYGGPHRYHVYWRELRIPFLPYTGNVYSVKILPVYGRIRKGILSQEYSMIPRVPQPPSILRIWVSWSILVPDNVWPFLP